MNTKKMISVYNKMRTKGIIHEGGGNGTMV